MPSLDVADLTNEQRPTGIWAASLLHAIARDEAAGRRMPRLTEPKLDTWSRFRGRLTSTDFIALLFEDAAVLHRVPFDSSAVGGPMNLERLPESLADAWLTSIGSLSRTGSGSDYVLDQARLLGLPARVARSELQVVRSHRRGAGCGPDCGPGGSPYSTPTPTATPPVDRSAPPASQGSRPPTARPPPAAQSQTQK